MTLRSVALVSFLGAVALAAQHPNFSGTWKLNLAESDFTDKHTSAPDSLVWIVQQKGDGFKYRILREKDGKKGEGHVDVTAGGSPEDSFGEGNAAAGWKDDKVVFKLLSGPENQVESFDTWSLSADGKKLTSEVVFHLLKNGGEVHMRRVFDKKN